MIPDNQGSVSSLALLTVSLPPSYRASAGVPAGRGVGCRSRDRLWYHLPTAVYLWIPVFSRTTGSVARGDIAGVGLLTVGGFTSGPIYFRASKFAWGLFALGGLRPLTLSV